MAACVLDALLGPLSYTPRVAYVVCTWALPKMIPPPFSPMEGFGGPYGLSEPYPNHGLLLPSWVIPWHRCGLSG